MTKKKGLLVAIGILLLVFFAGVFFFLSRSYKATIEVIDLKNEFERIEINEQDDYWKVSNRKENSEQAIIFYQGARVEEKSYLPLAARLAAEEITVFIPKLPLDLAILNYQAADDIIAEYSEYEWVLGGHSLGGAMAAKFAKKNQSKLTALFLLASYPGAGDDLSDFSGEVLSITANLDGVIDQHNLEKRKKLLPKQTKFVEIDGGNHAQFGAYGLQRGDKAAEISLEEQLDITVEEIVGAL